MGEGARHTGHHNRCNNGLGGLVSGVGGLFLASHVPVTAGRSHACTHKCTHMRAHTHTHCGHVPLLHLPACLPAFPPPLAHPSSPSARSLGLKAQTALHHGAVGSWVPQAPAPRQPPAVAGPGGGRQGPRGGGWQVLWKHGWARGRAQAIEEDRRADARCARMRGQKLGWWSTQPHEPECWGRYAWRHAQHGWPPSTLCHAPGSAAQGAIQLASLC